jgi:hypothetical protein
MDIAIIGTRDPNKTYGKGTTFELIKSPSSGEIFTQFYDLPVRKGDINV